MNVTDRARMKKLVHIYGTEDARSACGYDWMAVAELLGSVGAL